MNIHIKKVGAISAAVVTAGLISVSGVAGASGWGGHSHRHHDFGSRRITNTNNVDITNTTDQSARSGDVRVSGNRYAGDATSGDATNINRSNFDVNIRNR